MEWSEKEQLIAALCECPSLIDEERRGTIFFELPPAIRDGAPRCGSLRADVTGLVNACLAHPGGMDAFLRILRFYEQDSLPMQAVEKVRQAGDTSVGTKTAQKPIGSSTQAQKPAPKPPAQAKHAAAAARKRRIDMAIGLAGMVAGLLAALLLAQPLRCALVRLSETGLALLSLLLAGVTAGVNALPGSKAGARVRLAGGGFACGLFLFTVYAFLWPVDPSACPAVVIPPSASATPTLTGTPQPIRTTLPATETVSPVASWTATQPAPPPPATITTTPRTSPTVPAQTSTLDPAYTQVPVSSPTPTPYTTRIAPIDGAVQVLVPRGPFLLGADTGDLRAAPDQTVYLQAFWINQTEVTNEQYARCVQARACRPPAYPYSSTRSSYYDNSTYAQYPVVFVTWAQAAQYCAWAGQRLPSEAEWEKAARGIDGRIYPWGEESVPSSIDCERSAVKGCAADTLPAGAFPAGASPYGALDLAGNVAEWTASRYLPYPYDPADGRENPLLKGKDILRVVRGGSWASFPLEATAYYRSAIFASPERPFSPSSSSSLVGFRCAGD